MTGFKLVEKNTKWKLVNVKVKRHLEQNATVGTPFEL